MEIILTLVIILAIATIVNRIYERVNLENYSPIWEYAAKSFLYGLITVFTLFYGKESFSEVSPLEWAIIAVSFTEGAGNYINYIKESKKLKRAKQKKK